MHHLWILSWIDVLKHPSSQFLKSASGHPVTQAPFTVKDVFKTIWNTLHLESSYVLTPCKDAQVLPDNLNKRYPWNSCEILFGDFMLP